MLGSLLTRLLAPLQGVIVKQPMLPTTYYLLCQVKVGMIRQALQP